jgi:hypothetical protein
MTQLGEIQYVPRKSVTRFRLNGFAQVPGHISPRGWAVPMQYVGMRAEQVEAAPPPKQPGVCDCGDKIYARGMCYRHWYRWRQG